MYILRRPSLVLPTPSVGLSITLNTVWATFPAVQTVAGLSLDTRVDFLPSARLTLHYEFRQHRLIGNPPPRVHLSIVLQTSLLGRICNEVEKRFRERIALDLLGRQVFVRLGRCRSLVPGLVKTGIS